MKSHCSTPYFFQSHHMVWLCSKLSHGSNLASERKLNYHKFQEDDCPISAVPLEDMLRIKGWDYGFLPHALLQE